LRSLLEFQQKKKCGTTFAVYRVPDPSRCGIVSLALDGVVEGFVEKPANPASNLAFAGVIVATPDFLEALPNHVPADIGFEVLPRLVGKMTAWETTDFLQDIGTLQNYEEVQKSWPEIRA